MTELKVYSPADVKKIACPPIPQIVIDVFNTLLVDAWEYEQAMLLQDEVLRRLMLSTDLPADDIIARGWLNIEEIFRAEGWHVFYFRPVKDEDFAPYFLFKEKE